MMFINQFPGEVQCAPDDAKPHAQGNQHAAGLKLVRHTKDEIEDVDALSMALSVNGHPKQQGSTSTMIFKPAYLVWYISQFMKLEAGDLISTGTPPGVGMGQDPPEYIKPGDEVELSIEGLGEQKQTFVRYRKT